MKNTDFPLKKTFEYDFLDKEGKNLFTIKYEQATIDEYDEFMFLPMEKRFEVLFSFVTEHLPVTWYQKILKTIFKKYVTPIEASLDFENVVKNIMINKFRSYPSIFENVPAHLLKKGSRKGLYSANISQVCHKYNISIHELRNTMTLEQYQWMCDGVIFANNEDAGKEGQVINKFALIDKDEVKRRAQRNHELFSKIK